MSIKAKSYKKALLLKVTKLYTFVCVSLTFVLVAVHNKSIFSHIFFSFHDTFKYLKKIKATYFIYISFQLFSNGYLVLFFDNFYCCTNLLSKTKKFKPQSNGFLKIKGKVAFSIIIKKSQLALKIRKIIGSKVWTFFLNCKKF